MNPGLLGLLSQRIKQKHDHIFFVTITAITINNLYVTQYRKIPIISPGLIFVQKAFLLGLFSGELIFGGAYCWREFAFKNGLGLTIKTA